MRTYPGCEEYDEEAQRRIYEEMLPAMRDAARKCGYALAVHGSMERDLDLVAVPWIEEPEAPVAVAFAITKACGGLLVAPDTKRHHRLLYQIDLPFRDGENRNYIEVSVTPMDQEGKTMLVDSINGNNDKLLDFELCRVRNFIIEKDDLDPNLIQSVECFENSIKIVFFMDENNNVIKSFKKSLDFKLTWLTCNGEIIDSIKIGNHEVSIKSITPNLLSYSDEEVLRGTIYLDRIF